MARTMTWTAFKSQVTAATPQLPIVYNVDATGTFYFIQAFNGQQELDCIIPITSPAGSDQSDFETNFKPNANGKLDSVDPTGNRRVSLDPSRRSTYSACTGALTPAATPTDIVTITGSASTLVYVTRFTISMTQTLSGTSVFNIVKRFTPNTGGTSTALTAVPRNGLDGAADATVVKYSANPTVGSASGLVRSTKLMCPASGTYAAPWVWDFTNDGLEQGVVLLNANQSLSLNFGGASLPGGLSINLEIDWIEMGV